MWKGAEGCSPPRTQKCLFKSGVSYNVGGVKYFSSIPQHALGEERHFVLVEKVLCPTKVDLELSAEQLNSLNQASQIELGFP